MRDPITNLLPLILIAIATTLGLSGDVAARKWALSDVKMWLLVCAVCWTIQSVLWLPIFKQEGLARALNTSSAMWLIGSTLIGVYGFNEPFTLRDGLGFFCCFMGMILLRQH